MTAFTLWELWIERNTTVFSSENKTSTLVAQRALAAAVERWNVVECGLENPWVNWDRLGWVSLPSRSFVFVVWRAPPPEWFKINFDCSVVSSSNKEGVGFVGFVARDHDGKLLVAVSTPLLDVSAPLAEMIAAWNAIKLVIFLRGGN